MDSLDWKDYDAETICKRVTSKVQPGSIVLFHNAALHTPEALPTILSCLINDGYPVVPISQLILDAPYTIDHTGRHVPAEPAGEANAPCLPRVAVGIRGTPQGAGQYTGI